MCRIIIAIAAVCLAFAAYAGAASAAGFAVTTTFDAVDAFPGDGVCADVAGSCTLRAAVQEANALAGWDDIKVPGGTYPLTPLGAGEDLAASGDLDVRDDLGIYGDGPRRTVIDGQQSDRIFDVRGATVSMSGLAIRNGVATQGGGIRARASTLYLRWAALYINSAPSSGVWPFITLGAGGGIYASDSYLALLGVTLFSNRASEMGGAIYQVSSAATAPTASAKFYNVTVHGNSARRGGGIFTHTVPTALRNVTIANNFSSLGGGIYWLNIPPTAYNTTVAYNTGQDCSAFITSAANNNDTDKTCGFFGLNDLPGVDPFLDPLTYLGVVTPNWVRPLQPASPLRDNGDPATCTATDEVGQPRPVGPVCDIGAYEQP
jgi:CSLREA domain-containing protein